jgi:hypothetical protein
MNHRGRREREKLTSRQKSGIPITHHRKSHRRQPKPRAIWLRPADVWEIFAVETLGFEGAVKEDVDYAHGDVVDYLRGFSQIRQPI